MRRVRIFGLIVGLLPGVAYAQNSPALDGRVPRSSLRERM